MLSISTVSASGASSYYTKDGYYTQEQGEWQGKGAEALGLSGPVDKEQFTNLLEGKSQDGTQEFIKAGGNGEHRAGLDLTFSAPKSVSVLSEVVGDERVKEAHDKAVSSTLNYIELSYSQARQKEDGESKHVDTGNLIIAKFDHNLSRELDPQLHTHCVVANITKREDGEWRALSNEQLYDNKILFGQHYRNELSANLKELGYTCKSDEKGLFEVQGVDQKLMDHFSERKSQIDEKVAEYKEQGKYENLTEPEIREKACLASRSAKQDVDIESVKEGWGKEIEKLGYSKESIIEATREATTKAKEAESQRTEPKMNSYDYVRLATKAITEQESTFSKEDVLKVAGKMAATEHRIGSLDKAFDELKGKDKEVVQLAEKDGKSIRQDVYTTKEMQKTEKDIVEKVQAGKDKMEPVMSKERVERGLQAYQKKAGFDMTAGQKEAAEHILTSKDKVIGIQGDAGSGKTTMLAAARSGLEAEGYTVRGLSFTGKAASEIEAASGIKSQTLHSFLNSFDTKYRQETEWSVVMTKGTGNGNTLSATVQGMGAGGSTMKHRVGDKLAISTDDKGNQYLTARQGRIAGFKQVTESEKERGDPKAHNVMKINGQGKVTGISVARKDLSKDKQCWVVDEASMVGSKQMHDLLAKAEKVGAKVVLIGDTKQLQAVDAGKMFSKLQQDKAMETVRMPEVLRQKDDDYKAVVKDVTEKKIDKAFDKLEGKGKVTEIADRGERLAAVTKEFTKGDHKGTIIVTARNSDRNELNTAIRSELKEQGKLKGEEQLFTVREAKNNGAVDKHFAQSYKEGDLVISRSAGVIGKAGVESRVTAVDDVNHKISVHTKGGKDWDIDLKKNGKDISAFTEKRQGFMEGDKVVFTKNDTKLGVQNGLTGEVSKVDKEGNLNIKLDSGKDIKFNIRQYSYIDSGFAVTDYKAQGQTSEKVIYHADTSKEVNYNQAYVALTRGKEDVKIFTDSKEDLKEQMKSEQVKTSTLGHDKDEVKGQGKEDKVEAKDQVKDSGKDQSKEVNDWQIDLRKDEKSEAKAGDKEVEGKGHEGGDDAKKDLGREEVTGQKRDDRGHDRGEDSRVEMATGREA